MSSAGAYVRVARLSAIPEGKALKVAVGGTEIALWRVRGQLYAIGNVCSHQHFSELHHGQLKGLTVTCPMHGWTYSLETGIASSGSGRVPTFSVKIEGDDVFLEAPPEDAPWTR
ncbi:MAG TPA: Rieske 2Fe-2S domain-containing protein [Bacteroidota bacterium]|nr:Rieske 2Fe-2S domain-containing protein [Bacteroidota bacterium]